MLYHCDLCVHPAIFRWFPQVHLPGWGLRYSHDCSDAFDPSLRLQMVVALCVYSGCY